MSHIELSWHIFDYNPTTQLLRKKKKNIVVEATSRAPSEKKDKRKKVDSDNTWWPWDDQMSIRLHTVTLISPSLAFLLHHLLKGNRRGSALIFMWWTGSSSGKILLQFASLIDEIKEFRDLRTKDNLLTVLVITRPLNSNQLYNKAFWNVNWKAKVRQSLKWSVWEVHLRLRWTFFVH